MNSAVAIISVISSAVVALVVALIAAWSQASQRREASYSARVDDLRATLDAALEPVLKATLLLQFTLRSWAPADAFRDVEFVSPVPADFDPAAALREADRLRADVWGFGIRLSMRLGPSHAIVKQYSAQLRCLRRASRMLTQVEHGDRKNVRWPQEVRGHLDDAYSSGLELAAAASDLLAIGARRRGR